MAAKSGKNFSPLHKILLYYYPVGQNFFEIALSLAVSEIFTIFYFPLKSKMGAKSGKN